jgi:RNA polymerase sigma factor (sigma-70 family)
MAVALRSTDTAAAGAEPLDVGRLFEAHSSRLLAFCTRQLRSRSDAEDAVQTTFLYAHRALERGVRPENEHAWLLAIARNVCRWQRRTLARRGSLTTDVDLDAFPAAEDAESDIRDLREELENALASIPESQRHAIMLREVHGLASHEVASRLGMSTAATYALLTRARRSLARAVTASRQRPVLGLDFGSLLLKLKALLAGSTAKAVATSVAVGSVAIGGVAVERAVVGGDSGTQRPAPVLESRSGPAVTATSLQAGVAPTEAISSVLRDRGASGQMPATGHAPAPAPPRAGAASPPELAAPPSVPAWEPAGSPAVAESPTGTAPVPDTSKPLPAPGEVVPPPELPAPEDLLDPVLEDVPPVELPPGVEDILPPAVEDLLPTEEGELEETVDQATDSLPKIDLPLP